MKIDINTIRAAQHGESESMADLSMVANKRAFTYIYRLTIDYHLSQDLAQETVLDLIKSMPKLQFQHPNFFWSWLYRTALGKVQHHFRAQGNNKIRKNTTLDNSKLERYLVGFESGINTLMKKEMRKAVIDAMQNVRLRYRNILTLRCLDNLSYAEIAAISGGSELQARLLFFRAKRSLRHELARKGIRRDQILSALGVFGVLTAAVTDNAAAAASISAATLTAGSATTFLGISMSNIAATTVVGIITLSIVTGVVIKQINRYKLPPLVPPTLTYVNPTPHPFENLLYLLDRSEFSGPTQVTNSEDPDGDGFRVVDTSIEKTTPYISTPDEALIQDTKGILNLIMPYNHWVEVEFDGPIVDGPGPDLFYTGWNCRSMRVVLIGEQGQNYMLPILNCLPDCPARCFCNQIAPFDLAKFNLNFTPVRVRLQGIYGMSPYDGFQLSLVRARIANQRMEQNEMN